MTLLCVPIMADSIERALEDALAAKQSGADLVEFRVDLLFDPDGESDLGSGGEVSARRVEQLVRDSPLPCIVTCRPTSEGGQYDGDEPARIALFQRLGAMEASASGGPPRFLDVELETYTRSANLKQKIHLAVDHPEQIRDLKTSLILSFHDFQGRPADLLRRVAKMRAEPAAAVHKIAFRARSLRDNLELFDLLAERDRPTIALAMGEPGLMSRVLAPKFGGFLTFASLRPESTTAPGQPTVEELLNLYRFRAISPTTKVYGVIGWPVEHSLSPLVHNAGFHAPGIEHDGVYLPLPVAPEWEHFKATTLALLDHPRLDFSGASVTIPHKQHLFRLAGEQGWEIDPLANRIGAANTMVVDRTGGAARMRICNTDAPAAVECLKKAMGWVKGKRIAVIGAGGVARAVVAGLVDEGATVAVYARRHEQAEKLVADLRAASLDTPGKAVAAPWDKLCGSCCEAFVNCTPMGMQGGGAESDSPISSAELEHAPPGTVVMDTVYAPLRTPLLIAALENNFPTIDGAAMFVRQAELQFRAWTNRDAPGGLFDRLVRERLSKG